MKKVLPLVMAVAALGLASCDKERQCKCTTDNDNGFLKVFTVDRAIACDDLKEMIEESKWTVDGEQSLRRDSTTLVHLSCREYNEK